jgi:excisionase family DNA binding protein
MENTNPPRSIIPPSQEPPTGAPGAPSASLPRLFLTASEVGQQLGIHRSRVYELAAGGLLPVIRLGRRMLFPRRGLEELAALAIERVKAEVLDAADDPATNSATALPNASGGQARGARRRVA